METFILHSSYHDRVIESKNKLISLLDRNEFFLSYINLYNFRLNAMGEVTSFIIDSSVLAKAVGVECMSPDFSSVMDVLLSKSNRILYIGGFQEEIIKFTSKQKKLFPKKDHVGLSGYGIELQQYLLEVFKFAPDTIIISVGYGFQESLGSAIKRSGFKGKIICSGAFISQDSRAYENTFFPNWIIELNLRWLFRLFMEKTARKRFPQIVFNYMTMKSLKTFERLKRFLDHS